MQQTKLILEKFGKSKETLCSAIIESQKIENKEKFEFFRDSVIQRFEYTTEIAWKTLKKALEEIEWLECNSPKSCLKEWFNNWYLDNLEIWFAMMDARNSTSHNYEEGNSVLLYENILTYIKYINLLYESIKQRLN